MPTQPATPTQPAASQSSGSLPAGFRETPPIDDAEIAALFGKEDVASPQAPSAADEPPADDYMAELYGIAATARTPVKPTEAVSTAADAPAPLARRRSGAVAAASAPALGGRVARSRHLHWLMLLALVPLAGSMFGGSETGDRLLRTIEANPDVLERMNDSPDASDEPLDHLLNALPGHAIEGAFLARDTFVHWLFALASAGLFVALIVGLFDLGGASIAQVLLVGLFTSTAGILLLLGFQLAADWTQGYWVSGRGVIVILFYLVKLIGFSYHAALNPENGFLTSLLGFTFGVGLCEEITKALPVISQIKNLPELGWRGACVWGLASGAGFGIAEGVLYSSTHYNGIATGGIYLVRFVSCVALHAIWSATSALMIYRNQDVFDGIEDWTDMLLGALRVVLVPMILHGLYDTLLKRDMDAWALLVAVVSFLPLAWLIEQAHQDDGEMADRLRRRRALRGSSA